MGGARIEDLILKMSPSTHCYALFSEGVGVREIGSLPLTLPDYDPLEFKHLLSVLGLEWVFLLQKHSWLLKEDVLWTFSLH